MVKQFENDQHTLYHWGVALWNKRKKQYCNNNSDSNRLFCFCCAVSCVLVPTQSLKVYNKRLQETSTSQVAYDTALRILFLILAFFLLLPVHSDRKKKILQGPNFKGHWVCSTEGPHFFLRSRFLFCSEGCNN